MQHNMIDCEASLELSLVNFVIVAWGSDWFDMVQNDGKNVGPKGAHLVHQ